MNGAGGLYGRSAISRPGNRSRNAVVTLQSPLLDKTPEVASCSELRWQLCLVKAKKQRTDKKKIKKN